MRPFKGEISQRTTCNKEYRIVTNDNFLDPYWDEGMVYHKSRGLAKWKKKQILNYQVRMYRSWKHNRKTQHK